MNWNATECNVIKYRHEEECTHKLEQTNAKDPQKPPKINTRRWEEPRWVIRGTNKTKIEIFSLGEPEGVKTLTNIVGISQLTQLSPTDFPEKEIQST